MRISQFSDVSKYSVGQVDKNDHQGVAQKHVFLYNDDLPRISLAQTLMGKFEGIQPEFCCQVSGGPLFPF